MIIISSGISDIQLVNVNFMVLPYNVFKYLYLGITPGYNTNKEQKGYPI